MPGRLSAQKAPADGDTPRPITVLRVAAPPVPLRVEPRRRLVRRLLATTATRVVMLSAPAGYGKTALLEAWTAAEPRPAVWVSIDRAGGGAAEAQLALAVEELRATTVPTLLIVDDADVAGGAPAAQALDAVTDGLPACVTLVLCGRRAPPCALGGMRAACSMLELGPDELAMTHHEAAALLRAAGVSLGAAAVATLIERTEGWPAGLRLATVALSAQADLAAAVADFGGDDRVVVDYLREEVLAELSSEQFAFLTGASILRTLTGPVCDAVLDCHGSGLTLRDLGRSPVPITPLDRSEEHFRLHPLVADMLRAELHRTDPERARALHARATSYYEACGHVSAAIDHAIAGAQHDRVAALLWGVAPGALFDGRAAELRTWLDRIGEAQLDRRPVLALVAALSALAHGEHDQVERWLMAARSGADRRAAPAGRAVDAAVGLLHAAIAPGAAATLRDRADDALALTPEGGSWRAVCCLLRGVANGVIGDGAAARGDLEDGVRHGAVVMAAIESLCLAQLALQALLDGDADEGAILAERARTRIDARRLVEPMVRGFVCAVSAFARAQRGRVDEAKADVDEARRILAVRDALAPWLDVQARLALARAELRLADLTAARALLAEAARCAARMPDARGLHAWIDDAWHRTDTFALEVLTGPGALTTAELRVLRFLPSHHSFREIAEHLHVSANTVKTQAHAVYRKLDATSRSAAVTRARSAGLLDP